MRKVSVLALAPQVIWNFGTEGPMKEFGGAVQAEYEGRGQIIFQIKIFVLNLLGLKDNICFQTVMFLNGWNTIVIQSKIE